MGVIKKATLKRPASAAFLNIKSSTLNPVQQISMQNLFKIYDNRPASGF
jgi:hypothetical protein